MNIQDMQGASVRASALLRALGNEKRLMILCHLVNGEMSVGALGRALGLMQAPLSQQLARLRRDGLVTTRREAQTIYYALNGEEARRVITLLHQLYCGGPEGDAASQGQEDRE